MEKIVSFDWAIKYLLKDKGNYDIVEGFISALLKSQGYNSDFKIVALLDTESNKEESMLKRTLADLIVEDEDHNQYIVEIERQITTMFIHKAVFNTSRLIVDHVSSGANVFQVKKVFHITLLYFDLGEGSLYHGKTIVKDVDTGQRLSFYIRDRENNREYEALNILPEYFFISIPNFNDVIKREIDEWLYVMKHEEVRPEFKSQHIEKVINKLGVLKMTKAQRDEYFFYAKQLHTHQDNIQIAEERGRTEGRTEEKIEIAVKMLGDNLPIETIMKITGLTKEEIKALKK